MLLESPGTTCVSTDPPPGPLTACRLILCVSDVPGEFFSVSSTMSPWRTRIIGPGTVPLKVQNRYATPSASRAVTSRVSRSTLTSAGCLRSIGGATCGCGMRVTPSGRGFTTDATGGLRQFECWQGRQARRGGSRARGRQDGRSAGEGERHQADEADGSDPPARAESVRRLRLTYVLRIVACRHGPTSRS